MIHGVYLVLDPEATHGRPVLEVAEAAMRGGVSAVQWRQKTGSIAASWTAVLALHALCGRHEIPFIVNDRVDVALALDAEGVHVGQEDIPADFCRRLLPGKILGVSVTRTEEIPAAVEAGADYLGVGPIFPTRSKHDAAGAGGLALLREARSRTSLPLVAIGGITAGNAEQVRVAGADAVAVISALCGAADVEPAARDLAAAFEGARIS